MGINLLDLPEKLKNRRTASLFDDFHSYTDAGLWTKICTDSGTAVGTDAAKGILTITASDGFVADNDESYVATTQEPFLLAAGKPLLGECSLQFTEANTDDANVFFGFANAIAANTLVDNGAGLKTNFHGTAIYKVDGGTVWKFVTSLGATQTISTSVATAGGSAYQVLRIEINPINSTQAEAIPYVNGVQLTDSNGKPIKHLFTYTSTTEMMVGVGVKNGGANLETLLVDYIGAAHYR